MIVTERMHAPSGLHVAIHHPNAPTWGRIVWRVTKETILVCSSHDAAARALAVLSDGDWTSWPSEDELPALRSLVLQAAEIEGVRR